MHSRSSEPAPTSSVETSDPLAAVIALLRPQTVFAKIVSGAGSWSIRYAPHRDPAFGLVLQGSSYLQVDGQAAIELQRGDFVLLPATPGFTMATDLGLPPTLVTPTQARELRHGKKSGPPSMRMLGGYFRFDPANAQLLVKLLPALVFIRRDEPGATRLRRLAELIGDETGTDRPGREPILERLVEVLLIEALRFRSASSGRPEQGLFSGLGDPALARPLRKLHADVRRRWTVAELARAAGMSRAVFAERFTRVVGLPPMQYLLEWRMAMAKDILRRERPPLAEVADRVGYQSASAFSTAFSRIAGHPPSTFARATSEATGESR